MSNSDEDEPRFWPLKWARDEKFWRDVVVQMSGTGAVALLVFLWAGAAGYLTPAGQTAGFRLTAVVVAGVILLLAAFFVVIIVISAKEMQRREGGRAGLRYAVGLTVLFVLMLSPVVVLWIISVVSDAPVDLG